MTDAYTFENTYMTFGGDLYPRSIWRNIWYQLRLRVLLVTTPIARYKGKIRITADSLVFDGNDRRRRCKYSLRIPYSSILSLCRTYDDNYPRAIDFQLGRSEYLIPVRITFRDGIETKTIYILSDFTFGIGGPSITCSNEKLERMLREKIQSLT